jgi:hypothetical protein
MSFSLDVIPFGYHTMDFTDYHVVVYQGEKYLYKMTSFRSNEVAWEMGKEKFISRLAYLVANGYDPASLPSFYELPQNIQEEVKSSTG